MTASLSYPFAGPPAAGETLEVAPGVLWLRMPLPFALDHINLWLLKKTTGYVLVDTGYGDAVTRDLWDVHAATTLKREPLRRIVATHFHPDHLGNARWLMQRYGTGVAMTAGEYLTAHAVHGGWAGYSAHESIALFHAHGLDDAHLKALTARGNRYAQGVPELPNAFERLFPGSTVRLAGSDWRIIGGYGHSPEHAALYSPDRRVLISGDMLLPRISTNVSVAAAEPHADSLGRFLASIAAFEALPADTLVLPSHGLPFRGIASRVEALRDHHAARLSELLEAVAAADGPVCAADMLPVLFRRELDTQQRFFAMGEAIAHLNHLVAARALHTATDASGRIRFTKRIDALAS